MSKVAKLGKRYKGQYCINWPLEPNKGIKEVYIAEDKNDIPCFERFVYVWEAKTNKYLGMCGKFWFKDNLVLDIPRKQ
jgi:hypothetical protein